MVSTVIEFTIPSKLLLCENVAHQKETSLICYTLLCGRELQSVKQGCTIIIRVVDVGDGLLCHFCQTLTLLPPYLLTKWNNLIKIINMTIGTACLPNGAFCARWSSLSLSPFNMSFISFISCPMLDSDSPVTFSFTIWPTCCIASFPLFAATREGGGNVSSCYYLFLK